ncbi:WD repeat-containing protein 18 isoform X2 [Anoplophora glabripennis]|uniref:WD repeat-containing protein 18 isoform X2 n=1 Tax=Anoplophora glabripennis TaxID=217634 RepID=UPI0008740DA5|nr:WD repeat-containing protein 18 isoform X2 [Anoplophora glabripennis]
MDINELLITSSVSSESSACLWDYNTLNVRKLFKNGGVLTSKGLEVVGQDYILGSELGKPILHVWPLNSQECSKNTRLILPEVATCLALCPRNIYFAAGINCKVYVWQLTSGKLLSVHQKNYQPVTIIKFSSDGDYLLIAGQDGMLVVYNFAELVNLSNSFLTQTDIGQVEPIYIKNDHSMPITDLHVGSFGRKSQFATVSSDQTCRIYNLADGEALLTLIFNEVLTATVFDAPCWQLFVGNNNGSIHQFSLKNPPRKLYHHIEGKSSLVFGGPKGKVGAPEIKM